MKIRQPSILEREQLDKICREVLLDTQNMISSWGKIEALIDCQAKLLPRLNNSYAAHTYNGLWPLIGNDVVLSIARIWGRDKNSVDEFSLHRLVLTIRGGARREQRRAIAASRYGEMKYHHAESSDFTKEEWAQLEAMDEIRRYVQLVRAMSEFNSRFSKLSGNFILKKIKNRANKYLAHRLSETVVEKKISPVHRKQLGAIEFDELRQAVEWTIELTTEACYIFMNLSPSLDDASKFSRKHATEFWSMIGVEA